MSRTTKKPPRTALERLEQGKLTPEDKQVVARLLAPSTLSEAEQAVAEANAWADRVEKERSDAR